MNLPLFLAIAGAGGIGAALRFLVDGLVRGVFRTSYPLATTTINVSGSFALGLLTGLAVTPFLPHELQLVIGTGLLGGYTTFSTASYETVRLAQERRYASAIANGIGMLVLAVAAAALGYSLGASASALLGPP